MSIFTTAPQFEAFLVRAKNDPALIQELNGVPQNIHFIPRNFLIEEHLDSARATTYATELPSSGPVDFHEWNGAHNEYLKCHVFLPPPPGHNYRYVAQNDSTACPETFRALSALIPFQGTDLDAYFIRIVPVSDLAYLSGEKEARIFSLGEQVVNNPGASSPAREELTLILAEAFAGPLCDHRPVFAAFYEDFLDELRDPANNSWANRLRDRLGLYHISQLQPGGLPRRVFLFHYRVRHLPYHPADPGRRPIAIPVVLDHRFSPAFCPAPNELDRGRLLNLKANATEEPAREVLHLFMPMQVEHLFRVGLVTTPVPEALAEARRDHLIWLRLESEREDYGLDTDDDLFRI